MSAEVPQANSVGVGDKDRGRSADELGRQKLALECQKLEKEVERLSQGPPPEDGFLKSLGKQLKNNFFCVVNPVLLVLLTFLSTLLVEQFRGHAQDRQDKRKQFESISARLDQFFFSAECMQEALELNLTSKEEMTPTVQDYNQAITKLREKETSDQAIFARYWGSDAAQQFQAMMSEIKAVDRTMHGTNIEWGKVLSGKQERLTEKTATAVAAKVSQKLDRAKTAANQLLAYLSARL